MKSFVYAMSFCPFFKKTPKTRLFFTKIMMVVGVLWTIEYHNTIPSQIYGQNLQRKNPSNNGQPFTDKDSELQEPTSYKMDDFFSA
jgi:hypothetical protein